MGDSITDGTTAGGAVPGGYRDPLYQDLINEGFTFNYVGYAADNASPLLTAAGQTHHDGFPGWQINQMTSGLSSYPGTTVGTPSIILLLIGTNDFSAGNLGATDPSLIISRLDGLVTAIFAKWPATHLFLSNLITRTDQTLAETQIETYFNPYVPGIVSSHSALGQNVTFVDMHSVINPATDLSTDKLHPNAQGYKKMGDAWNATVVPEPSTYSFLGVALCALFAWAIRFRRAVC